MAQEWDFAIYRGGWKHYEATSIKTLGGDWYFMAFNRLDQPTVGEHTYYVKAKRSGGDASNGNAKNRSLHIHEFKR